MKDDIEVIVFEKPAGNIAALVSGEVAVEGKRKSSRCNVNARVYVDREPDVSINTSRGLTLSELAQALDMLQRFEARLHDLVAAYGPREARSASSNGAAVTSAAQALVRHHLDSVEVHPCDEHNDEVRARACIPEVQNLHAALQR
jgi:hypothetical protein